MKSRQTTVALVLKTRSHREHDRLVTLFTPQDGKVTVIAKGVRTLKSKRRAALQAGNIIRCSWVTLGERHVLTEAMYQESLLTDLGSLDRVRDFTGILEIVYHVVLESIEQEELFAQSVTLLRYVGQTEYHRGRVRQELLQLAEDQGLTESGSSGAYSASEVLEQSLGRKLHSFAFLS